MEALIDSNTITVRGLWPLACSLSSWLSIWSVWRCRKYLKSGLETWNSLPRRCVSWWLCDWIYGSCWLRTPSFRLQTPRGDDYFLWYPQIRLWTQRDVYIVISIWRIERGLVLLYYSMVWGNLCDSWNAWVSIRGSYRSHVGCNDVPWKRRICGEGQRHCAGDP